MFVVHREECDICMLVRRKSAWSVEMLAVLVVLVALVPTWSDGLLVTKCDLKSQLEAALSNLQVENAADIIAKCKLIRLIIGIDIMLMVLRSS